MLVRMRVNPARSDAVTTVVRMCSPFLRRLSVALAVVVVLGGGLVVAALGGDARAQVSVTSDSTTTTSPNPATTDASGVQHLHLEYGPLSIRPGQNVIDTNKYLIPQPT